MVFASRKYLCQAPRPEVWEDHADNVLKNLPVAEQEAVIRHTLAQIRAKHPLPAKSGPGRKSNKEHAVHFYEYLLERVTSKDNTEQQDETGEESSMGTEEFNREHNDLCEICEKGGDLLMCSTCNLVFHLPCVRPVMTELPNDPHWRCSYCILGSEPKNTKARRTAAAAVRLMARLRNQNKRNRAAQQEDTDQEVVDTEEEEEKMIEKIEEKKDEKIEEKDEEKEDSETKEESEESDADKKKEAEKYDTDADEGKKDSEDRGKQGNKEDDPEATPKRRNLALYKLSDSSGITPPADGGRGKRHRKQPALYDPQSVPARKWMSDEFQRSSESEESGTDDNDETEQSVADDASKKSEKDDESKKTESDVRTPRHKGDGEFWCSFCQDDPSIKLCCFCGCRVCFGKHSQTKLLLCDRCDDEYHTHCLDPPLSSIPKTTKWFCPNCSSHKEKKVGRSASRIGTRGANKKSVSPTRSSNRKAAKDATSSEKKRAGRPRGRPPKKSSTPSNTPSTTGRKRGRPPKSASSSTSPPKKRGRPPKSKSPGSGPRSTKSRDSTVSISTAPEFPSATSSVTAHRSRDGSIDLNAAKIISRPDPIPVKVSRSGRAVKRSAFHDEIEQGDQHLRSLRYEMQRSGEDYVESGPTQHVNPSFQTSTAAAEATRPTMPLQATTTVSSVPSLAVQHAVSAPAHATLPSGQPAVVPTVQMPKSVIPTQSGSVPATNPTTSQPQVTLAFPSGVVNPMITQGSSKPVVASALPPSVTAPPATFPFSQVAAAKATATSHLTQSAVDAAKEATKQPRRKPGARECMQISRRFGVQVIPQKYMDILSDYCKRGKVEHLIRMRERLDEHSRYLECQLAGLEALVKEKGEPDVVVPPIPQGPDKKLERTQGADLDD